MKAIATSESDRAYISTFCRNAGARPADGRDLLSGVEKARLAIDLSLEVVAPERVIGRTRARFRDSP
jgi:hypothetical protein